MKKLLLLLFLFFLACQESKDVAFSEKTPNKFIDINLQKIYDFQDKRQTDSLIVYLSNPNEVYREAAAMAMASVQDKAAVEVLLSKLNDSSHKVRRAIMYALGQIGEVSAAKIMWKHLSNELDTLTWQYALEAIGKCGDSAVVAEMTDSMYEYNTIIYGKVLGIYRAMLKKVIVPNADKMMFDISVNQEIDDSVKTMASYYLARRSDKKYQKFENHFEQLLKSPISYIRANTATASLGLDAPQALKILQKLSQDQDVLVRVQTARALANFEEDSTLYRLILDEDLKVQHSALESLLKQKPKSNSNFLSFFEKIKDWQSRAYLLALAIKNGEQSSIEKTKELYDKSKNNYEKGFLLKSLAQSIQEFEFLEDVLYQQETILLKVYALEAVLSINHNEILRTKKTDKILKILEYALKTKDEALVALAAQELANKYKNYAQHFKNLDFLYNLQKELPTPQAHETIIALQEAIEVLSNKKSEDKPKIAFNNPIDWDFVKNISIDAQAVIKTERGDIWIEFFVEDAPASVSNFMRLAQEKFFDDKVFHRVVPNFVIQGGCPRGDGYGGKNYTIRSELAKLHYGTGFLGMASAGKDTESCQWFITHSPTPHLDGRYSIFARVIKGMEVVQKIEIGDKILHVEVLNN